MFNVKGYRLKVVGCALLFTGLLFAAGCTEEGFVVDDGRVELSFSSDTLTFDTVFATVGTGRRYVAGCEGYRN